MTWTSILVAMLVATAYSVPMDYQENFDEDKFVNQLKRSADHRQNFWNTLWAGIKGAASGVAKSLGLGKDAQLRHAAEHQQADGDDGDDDAFLNELRHAAEHQQADDDGDDDAFLNELKRSADHRQNFLSTLWAGIKGAASGVAKSLGLGKDAQVLEKLRHAAEHQQADDDDGDDALLNELKNAAEHQADNDGDYSGK